jgi:hypothetical protein
LEQLEEEHDLNQRLTFNNHLMYFRIVQLANSKLQAQQNFAEKRETDEAVPITRRQRAVKNGNYISLGAMSNASQQYKCLD